MCCVEKVARATVAWIYVLFFKIFVGVVLTSTTVF